MSPNRPDRSYRDDFGGANNLQAPFARPSEAARNLGPATHGLRTSTKNESSLAAAYAPVKRSAVAGVWNQSYRICMIEEKLSGGEMPENRAASCSQAARL